MRIFICLINCVLILTSAKAQVWNWDSLPGQEKAKLMADKIYGILWHGDTVIRKLHPGGGIVWETSLPGQMKLSGVAASGDGTFFAGGTFTGVCSLNSYYLSSSGMADIWVARYSGAGQLLWITSFGSAGDDLLNGICMNGLNISITGELSGNCSVLGQQVIKAPIRDFFLAKISASGTLQDLKCAVADPSATSATGDFASTGLECASDPAGNIYVLGSAIRLSSIDTFLIGSNSYYGSRFLMKFDQFLQPQWKITFPGCYYTCYELRNLRVNSLGESMLLYSYSYFQSASDTEFSQILKWDNTGQGTATLTLQTDKKGQFMDFEIDQADNVFLTGYLRTPKYGCYSTGDCKCYLLTAKFNSAFALQWQKRDSTNNSYRCGNTIDLLSSGDIYVSGLFTNTIVLNSYLSATFGQTSFHARMGNPPNLVSIKEETRQELNLYPIPVSEYLTIEHGKGGLLRIFNLCGKVVSEFVIKEESVVVQLEDLPNGCYIAEWTHERACIRRKFIKF